MRPEYRIAIALLGATLLGCKDPGQERVLGTLEYERVELSSPRHELLVEVTVFEGDRVAVDDVVARLDDRLLQAERTRLESERRRAEAWLAEVLRGPRAEAIQADRARLSGAVSELRAAQAELERIRGLIKRGLASASQLDQAEARAGRAQADRDATAEALAADEAGATAEEIDQAQAAAATAQASLAVNAVQLDQLTLRSPVDGVVAARNYQVGERPPTGAALVVLEDHRRLFAVLYVPDPLRHRLKPGQRVALRANRRDVSGEVRYRASNPVFTPYYALTEADRSRLAYRTEIDIIDPTEDLIAGVAVEWVAQSE